MALDHTLRVDDDSSGSETGREDHEAAGTKTHLSRKRQQYAAFAAWKHRRAVQGPSEETRAATNGVADELTSISALARQQEARVIISDPRDYQLELFEKARRENIVAVLATGSGKTLIAVLLMRHMFDEELERRAAGKSPRLAFFLVDSVALVYQQYAVLECNLNQKVDRLSGVMDVDSWTKDTWNETFEKNMAIVCTADILLNCLVRSYISMDRISLLIFDEAHHTKRNHPYARIVKEFYLEQAEQCRPKIFGMTASPVDAKIDPVEAARELEAVMHSRIATTQDLALLRNSIARPQELVLDYEAPLRTVHPLNRKLHSEFGGAPMFARWFERATIAATELGSWCADQFWMSIFSADGLQKLEEEVETDYHARGAPRALIDQHVELLRKAKDIIDDATDDRLLPSRENGSLSSKVQVLESFLQSLYSQPSDTRCIVFVRRRSTARLLAKLFDQIRLRYMRHAVLMGTRKAEEGDPSISIHAQLLALTKFRKGEYNLLFATSVAEEGLDIPSCNSIVRFDLYETLIQYIQSRGRARHAKSQYAHMIEKGNALQLQALRDVRKGEETLQSFCQSLPADRILQGYDDVDVKELMAKERRFRVYREPETGAKLAYWSAPQLLSQFIGSIPEDSDSIIKPEYIMSTEGKLFRCEVLLPKNAPIRSVIGRAYSRKAFAKASAAFDACLKLRENGYLDNYLKSTFVKRLPEMRNARLAITVKKTNEYDMRTKPQFWKQGIGEPVSELYVTIIDLAEPCATGRPQAVLALLTRRMLPGFPSFPIFPRPGFKCDVLLTRPTAALVFQQPAINMLTGFTLRIFKHLFNKTFEHDQDAMPYWLAPVKPGWAVDDPSLAFIDWGVVETVHEQEKTEWSVNLGEADMVGKFIVDPGSGANRYFSLRLARELKAHDPVPEGCAPHKHSKSILDYSSSLWQNTRLRVQFQENQPVVEAYQIPHRRNWLDDWDREEAAARTKAFICLQPLMISSIPADVAEMGYIFPSVIWRIDAYLVTVEACSGLGLNVPASLALEAMTKDSDNTEEHKAEQIHFQRGMGKNYERLEFIGDCFLKMATSISLYAQNAKDDEFESHVKRMVMICNRNLFNTAQELKIYESIRSEGFHRRKWYPPGLKLTGGKGVNAKEKASANKHRLNDKAIADVCEALIGAALLTQQDSGRMDMAVKAVSIFVKNSDHNVKCWADYYKLYELPAYQTVVPSAPQVDMAKKVADLTGYQFKYPRLLASAFTHPSCPSTYAAGVPDYQRLEFLGDSLLDMACVNFLFYRHPERDPQWLTEHKVSSSEPVSVPTLISPKMAMVANKFLGALCVRLGFHHHLRQHHNALLFLIKNYVEDVTEAEERSNGSPDYWTQTKDPPKVSSRFNLTVLLR